MPDLRVGASRFSASSARHRALAMTAVVQVSTDDIAPRHRLAVWREALFQTEFNVDIEPISDTPFRAQATVRMLPGLRLVTRRRLPAHFCRNSNLPIRHHARVSS